MDRRIVISGLGPVSGLGLGIDPTWDSVIEGRCAIGRIEAFDPSGFPSQVGSEIKDFKVRNYVPKSYRKATKVMARDIELAVAAADYAVRDAGIVTKGTDPDAEPTYDSTRIGCHIGAGLIAADVEELTTALTEARDENGDFDIHKWGSEGMTHLTPLWLLKYLPNMLACHVTIIHDTQGPSNTITCGEASAGLSIGESLRVIQRDQADTCFCGGAESRLNLLVYIRQLWTDRLNSSDNDDPQNAVRPFCKTAAGSAIGEGGGIVVVEALDTFEKREGATAYAEIVGFGASQSVNIPRRNIAPDPAGRGIAAAINTALREAGIDAKAIDLIVPIGLGTSESDQAECAGLKTVFGDSLANIPIITSKSMAGNCGAGAGGLDVCIAAKALAEQKLPSVINCKEPLDGINAGSTPSRNADLNHVLVFSGGLGGQNAALILKRFG